jgi:hypothetical protein
VPEGGAAKGEQGHGIGEAQETGIRDGSGSGAGPRYCWPRPQSKRRRPEPFICCRIYARYPPWPSCLSAGCAIRRCRGQPVCRPARCLRRSAVPVRSWLGPAPRGEANHPLQAGAGGVILRPASPSRPRVVFAPVRAFFAASPASREASLWALRRGPIRAMNERMRQDERKGVDLRLERPQAAGSGEPWQPRRRVRRRRS